MQRDAPDKSTAPYMRHDPDQVPIREPAVFTAGQDIRVQAVGGRRIDASKEKTYDRYAPSSTRPLESWHGEDDERGGGECAGEIGEGGGRRLGRGRRGGGCGGNGGGDSLLGGGGRGDGLGGQGLGLGGGEGRKTTGEGRREGGGAAPAQIDNIEA